MDVSVFAEVVVVVVVDWGDDMIASASDDVVIAAVVVGVEVTPLVAIELTSAADTDGTPSDSGPQLRLLETLTEVFHSGICNVLLNATTLSLVDRNCEGLLTEIGELMGEGGRRTG